MVDSGLVLLLLYPPRRPRRLLSVPCELEMLLLEAVRKPTVGKSKQKFRSTLPRP